MTNGSISVGLRESEPSSEAASVGFERTRSGTSSGAFSEGFEKGEMSRVKPWIDHMRYKMEEKLDVNKQLYQFWKKNTRLLYDLVITHALKWPSLTVQWLPGPLVQLGKDYSVHKIILGTCISYDEPNYLMIAEVKLPLQNFEDHHELGYLGAVDSATGKVERRVEVIQWIPHKGKITRARHMPQKPCLIATKSVSSEVSVFDNNKHPRKRRHCSPDLRLQGHLLGGHGLSWSHLKDGHLLSGSDDKYICLWDISANSNSNRTIDPSQTYWGHTGAVEDVAWHWKHDSVFGSVGHDQYVLIWDTRTSTTECTLSVNKGHVRAVSEVNCLAFNPIHEWMLAASSAQGTIALYDIRNPGTPLYSLESHTGAVVQIAWSPKHEPILASCGADKRAIVWDIRRIGEEQSPKDAKDGPPELLFLHGGHTSKISDLSWNPHKDWVIASVSEDNIVQMWEMAEEIHDRVI